MTFRELLDAGDLNGAIDELSRQLKAKPTDTSLRVSLFELLCFTGDLDRAAKQLEVVGTQASGAGGELAVQGYRDLLAAERARRDVFHGGALPKFLLSPPRYVETHVLMIKKLQNEPADAVAMLPEAEEQFPALTGTAPDQSFSVFRDADDRIAPVLEVFHGANYVWLPFEQITHIQVSDPKSIRDLLWVRARVETCEQSVGDIVIPALYVDSHVHEDANVRLGRTTEWQLIEQQLVAGVGRRVFLIDDKEASLLELRDLRFQTARGAAELS